MLLMSETVVSPIHGTGILGSLYYDPYPPRFVANVKEILAQGLTLIGRLHPGVRYPMEDGDLLKTVDREGHVVSIVGYDDDDSVFLVADPWDTERWGGEYGGLYRIPYQELTAMLLMNASADAAMSPYLLTIDIRCENVDATTAIINAEVSATPPHGVLRSVASALHDVTVSIRLPDGTRLLSARRHSRETLAPRDTMLASWTIRHEEKIDSEVRIACSAIVESQRPYSFRDVVGSQAIATLRTADAPATTLSKEMTQVL